MIRYLQKILNQLFDFNASERNGAVILVVLIALISGLKMWLAWHKPEYEPIDYADLELKLSLYEWQATLAEEVEAGISAQEIPKEDQLVSSVLADFDPNTVTGDELVEMGLSSKLAQTIVNYRNKGGIFRTGEDMKKIYGMSAGEFNRLLPHIRIGEVYRINYPATVKAKEDHPQVELNMADTAILEGLKGIGPVLANRIVKYRALLGGYERPEQLGEVYGISDSLLMSLEDAVYADIALIERIDINQATVEQLSRHPYIGRYYADGIILYREYTDTIRSMDELVANGLLPEDRAKKLKAYLIF